MTITKLYGPPHSEWAGRITLEITHIADAALHSDQRTAFGTKQIAMFKSMQECFDALLALHAFIEQHQKDLAAGKGGALTETGQIVLEHNPGVTLNRLFKDFIVKARTVIYHLFSIAKFLGHDLSFSSVRKTRTLKSKRKNSW